MFSCKNASTAERLFSSLRTRWECLWTRRVTLGLSVLPCNRCRSVGGDGACLSSMVWVSFQSYETIFSFAFGFGVFFLLQAPSGSRPMTRRSSVASSTSGPPPLPTSLPPHTPRALPPVLPPPRQRQTLPHSAGTGSFPTSPSSPSSPGFALPVPRPLPADTPPELPWRPSHAQPATTEVREVPQFRRQPMDMYMPGGVFGADPPEHLLRKAAKAGNQRRVRELLETHRGVRVNAIPVNGSGKTALYLAAERGHVEVVNKLLDYGADPTKRDNNGLSPLQAAQANNEQLVVIALKAAMQMAALQRPDGVTLAGAPRRASEVSTLSAAHGMNTARPSRGSEGTMLPTVNEPVAHTDPNEPRQYVEMMLGDTDVIPVDYAQQQVWFGCRACMLHVRGVARTGLLPPNYRLPRLLYWDKVVATNNVW
eukprot:m.210764 g.210764  ORF g.210764 m.210764 type:complete len:424 (+) comp18567_c0_seq3:1686-2957(+)